MKLDDIYMNRTFTDKPVTMTITINLSFDEDDEYNDKPDADALYYLICAMQKHYGLAYEKLDLMEQLQADVRFDECIVKLKETMSKGKQ